MAKGDTTVELVAATVSAISGALRTAALTHGLSGAYMIEAYGADNLSIIVAGTQTS